MTGGNMTGGNMTGGNMTGGNMTGGNMTGGNMTGGNMTYTNNGTDFTGGNMTATPATCLPNNTTTIVPSVLTYKNPIIGVNMAYPSNWEKVEYADLPYLYFTPQINGVPCINPNLAIYLPQDTHGKSIEQIVKNRIEADSRDGTVDKSFPIALDNKPGYIIFSTNTTQSTPHKKVELLY